MFTFLPATVSAYSAIMYKNAKEEKNENDERVMKYIDAPKKENEYRILKKTLTKEKYDKYKSVRTPNGGTLWDCLKSGVIKDDSKMGIYACDRESYDVFDEIFWEMIQQYFNTTRPHPGVDYGDLSSWVIQDALDLKAIDTQDLIVSTRVRVARNVKGFPYAALLGNEQRLEVEQKIADACAEFKGEEYEGGFVHMNKLDDATQAAMVEAHHLFHCKDEYIRVAGMFGDWPNGRGAYYNHDKSLMIWVNEEDHMRIISLSKGNDLLKTYTRLITAIQHIESRMDCDKHDKLGNLASCPTNLGTGLRASVHVKIPHFSAKPWFKAWCKDAMIDIRGIHGEHTFSAEGIFDVSNQRRFGGTEIDCITEMSRGVKNILRIEMELRALEGPMQQAEK